MSQLLKNFKTVFFLLLLCCPTGYAQVAPPQTVNFQGRLTDLSDNPLNGSFDITFTLYNAASGGVALWTETQTGVVVDNGSVETLLGSVTPIPYSAAMSAAAYLQIQVGAELLSPRQPFASVLYSMNSAQLSGRTYDMFMDLSSSQSVSGTKTFGTIIATNSITAARFYGNGSNLTGIIGDSLGNHTAIAPLDMSGQDIIAAGNVTAAKYYGDGGNLSGISGDNLGSHMASTALDMANFPVNNVSTLTVNNTVMAANFYGDGSMLTGVRGDDLGSHTATQPLNMSSLPVNNVSTLTVVNSVSAAKYYGDGSNLTGIAGDNLGSHTATMALNMAGYPISNAVSLTVSSTVSAAKYYGDGSSLTGIAGDNLGNHTASADLNMSGRSIVSAGTVTANNFVGDGSGLTGITGDNLGSHTATMALNMSGYPISNAATLNVSSAVTAAKYYGDGSNLTGIAGDNLGNHTATMALNMAGYPISNAVSLSVSSTVSAAKYYGDGSSLTGIAGDNLGNHTASADLNMSGRSIVSAGTVTANNFVGDGSGLTGITGDNLGSHTATMALNMAGYPISNAVSLTVSSNVTAAKYFGDGSGLTGIAGDNLGSHTATYQLNMGGYSIISSSDITAARYKINGITVLQGIAASNTVFVGFGAGAVNSGGFNTFVGSGSGSNNTTGQGNTFIGSNAGQNNIGGMFNTAVGENAAALGESIARNTVVGVTAGFRNLTGADNTYVGNNAGYNSPHGSANSVFGSYAAVGVDTYSFSSSTVMGYKSGYALTTGSDNVLFGFQAGDSLTTGSRNIIIGYDQDATAPTISDELNIGGLIWGRLLQGRIAIGFPNTLPQAALDVRTAASDPLSQVWRNDSGAVVATMSATGTLYASGFYGDGSSLTGIAGDNLGNHTASADLNMSGRSIVSVGTVTANNFVGDGSGLSNLNALAKTGGTLTGALNFSGAVPDITSLADEHITIMPAGAGNVGIGDGNPAAKLSVSGDIRAIGNLTVGTGGPATFSVGAGSGESFLIAPDNQTLTIKGTREAGLGNALQVQTFNAVKGAFLDRFTVTGATDTANIAMLNSNVGIGTNNPGNQFVLAHGTGVMNKVFLDGTIDDGSGVIKRVVSLSNTDGSNYGGYLALGNRYSPLTGPADGATVLLSGAPNQNSYISVGNVGIGTTTPGAKLDISGSVKIVDGTQGAGKVLTSDSAGLASWQAVSGDNLGDHMATQALNMSNFPVSNLSTITITGGGLFVINGTAADSNGLYIDQMGALQTRGFGNGTYMPDARGVGSVDLQTRRVLGMDNVAAGNYSTIAGGESNKVLAAADHAFIGAGDRNAVTAGQNGVVSGGYLNTLGGSHGFIGGGYGNTAGGGAYALVTGGKDNVAASQYSAVHGGYYNRVNDIFSEGSMVPGGANLTVTNSRYALAAGYWAAISYADGSFTWNDYHNTGGNSELVNNVPQRTLFKNRGGFMVTGSTNTALGATVNRGVFITGDGLVGISTGSPSAALDVVSTGTASNVYAQKWRNASGGVVAQMDSTGLLGVSSLSVEGGTFWAQQTNISTLTVTNAVTAAKFYGDGSGLTGVGGADNLGNHTGTMALQMGVYGVNTSSHVNAGAYQISGTKVLAVLPGIESLAVGLGAGQVDTGNNNMFAGYRAGYSNTNGFSNTFLGHQSGYSTTSGYNNTYVGQNAGYFSTTGIMNSMLGAAAGYSNTTGSNNTFMGDYAGTNNQTGSANALFGFGAGGYGAAAANSFSSSTVVGYKAGHMLGNGSADNVLVGFQAGDSLTTGSRNIIIGYNQDATAPTISNELNIGGIIWGNLQTGAVGLGLTTTLPQAALDVKSTGTAADQMAQVWRNSGGTIVSSVSATGVLMADKFVSAMGGSTGQTSPIGLAGVNLNTQATTGTTEETLLSYTLPANSLNANSKGVRIKAWGTAVSNSMTKVLRLRFGGLGGTVVASHTSMNESGWMLEAVIFRTGANTQKGFGSSLPQEIMTAAPAQTDTAAIDVALTGETSITLGEVSAEGLMVEFIN